MATKEYLPVENPATLEPIGRVAVTALTDLDDVVRSAESAQRDWGNRSDRPQLLKAVTDVIESQSEELARLLTREQGKPLTQARLEVGVAARAFTYFADLRLEPEVLREEAGQRVERHYHPLGVAALITAWNFPLALFAWKAASALSAGNAIITKPAPTTALVSLALQELLDKVLPVGLSHVVNGEGDLGAALVDHPGIQKVSFTGSTNTGRRIMSGAAPRLKRLTLELGGNDPALVLPNADLEGAVRGIAQVAFRNAGQVCIAPKRVLVPRAAYDDAISIFEQYLAEQTVGDGMDESTTIGPVHNRAQFESLMAYSESVAEDGGTFHPGPQPADLPGYFVRPALVSGLSKDAALACEEQFGPLLPIFPYETVDEAVNLANDTDYGLGSSVWGADVDEAAAVASRIRAGTQWVNQHGPAELDIPFGGVKQSGIGVELGREGLLGFTEARTINIKYSAK